MPAAARNDIGYKFARIQMLRRADNVTEAVALMRDAPEAARPTATTSTNGGSSGALLARKLLDVGDAKNAYEVARDATPPTRDNYRAEHQFMAGWIALRYLHDASDRLRAFHARSPEGNDNPISLARGAYWLGRAAEALKRTQEARTHYQEAARYPTAYYGQIARAKAGLGELTLNPFPALSSEQRAQATRSDVVRAPELLYAVDARDLAQAAMADLGDKSNDIADAGDAGRADRQVQRRPRHAAGRQARARARPCARSRRLPDHRRAGLHADRAAGRAGDRLFDRAPGKLVQSQDRLERQRARPDAGHPAGRPLRRQEVQRHLRPEAAAQRHVYNVQIGAAELGDVIKDYRGSYIMAFAAYNAGRGRVREWVERFGDPRDPKVDPIDWVERIPFSETRNYVQRVMENVQVYRVRFGGSPRLLIEADLRRGATAN